jgi:hypothetical protein
MAKNEASALLYMTKKMVIFHGFQICLPHLQHRNYSNPSGRVMFGLELQTANGMSEVLVNIHLFRFVSC